MTSKLTNSLLGLVIVLLLVNITLTTKVLKQQSHDLADEKQTQFEPAVAKEWGRKAIKLYNQQDHASLYELFHAQAKDKITKQQLETQLTRLYQLFGDIQDGALVNSIKLGEKGNEEYYQLGYKVLATKTDTGTANLTLSLIKTENDIRLYGFKLNALQSLE